MRIVAVHILARNESGDDLRVVVRHQIRVRGIQRRGGRILKLTERIAASESVTIHRAEIALFIEFGDAVSAERLHAVAETIGAGVITVGHVRIKSILTDADVTLFVTRIDDAVAALRQPRPPAGAVTIGIGLTVSTCLIALFAKADFHGSISAEAGGEMTASVTTGSRATVERT